MTSEQESAEANKACRVVVEQFFAALERNDLDAVLALYAPDVQLSLAGKLTICGTYTGREQLLEWAGQIFARLDTSTARFPTRYRIMAVEAPRVSVIYEAQARGLDGTDYSPTYCMIFEIEQGRIARQWEFADTALLEELFGNKLSRPQSGPGRPFVF